MTRKLKTVACLNMKQCNACQQMKPLTEYTVNKAIKDGYSNRCKVCYNTGRKHWRIENPEKASEADKRNRVKKLERIKEYRKAYWAANKERLSVMTKKWKEDNRDTECRKSLNRETVKRYGITLEEKYKMVTEQQNRCLICGNEFSSSKDTHVDHNHTTRKVRGILCGRCNAGIGNFRENAEYLAGAIRYIKEHNG